MCQISVALATFNGLNYIKDQLDSVLAQSTSPIEIVICDDFSTDGTWEILNDYKLNFPDIINLNRNQHNIGFINNFERAISLCCGDVIALCDQDDIWFSDKLTKFVDVFTTQKEYGMVYCEAVVVNEDLQPLGFNLYTRSNRATLHGEKSIMNLIRKTDINGCTIAFRSAYRPYLFPFPSIGWGHDHWISFLLGVFSAMKFIEEPLMKYRRHPDSSGNNPNLDHRIIRTVQQVYKNLTLDAYKSDYERWKSMTNHLETIMESPYSNIDIHVDALKKGLDLSKKRLMFAEKRLSMRKNVRSKRLSHACNLLFDGEYHQFTRGYRSFIKDLIA